MTGPKIVDEGTRARMRDVLKSIQSGDFAKTWIDEDASGRPQYDALMKRDLEHPIEEVGGRLRAQMPWLSRHQGGRSA